MATQGMKLGRLRLGRAQPSAAPAIAASARLRSLPARRLAADRREVSLQPAQPAPGSAQAPPPPTKSVYGKLLSVDASLNNVLMS